MAKDGDTGGKPKRSMLDTFVAPRPNRGLMRALAPVNRVLCLGGIPGLRRVPGLSAIPGVRGLSDIVRIDLPAEQEERLRAFVTSERAVFLTPNHPEFFTDWMLDKELLARVAPLAACWATNTIVNGMGARMQRFWLANNLIAQIPGAGGEGKAHSIRWAMGGHGVLLHPEGNVGWHGDTVARIFPGAVEMAIEAARLLRETGDERGVLVAPVVWKLEFLGDVRRPLAREMAYVERRLGLPARLNFVLERKALNPSLSWTDIAATAGYFDYKHLVRDFKAIAGTSPNAYLWSPRRLDDGFLLRRNGKMPAHF